MGELRRPVLSSGPGSPMMALSDAGIIPPNTHRVLIDLTACEDVRIYCQCFGDDALMEVGLADKLMGIAPIRMKDGQIVGDADGEEAG